MSSKAPKFRAEPLEKGWLRIHCDYLGQHVEADVIAAGWLRRGPYGRQIIEDILLNACRKRAKKEQAA